YSIPPPSLPSDGSFDRLDVRPDHPAQVGENGSRVSRSSAAHSLLRRRERLATHFPHQPFPRAGFDHCSTLSGSLASGIALPMDQTTSPHQGFLRNFRECGKDPSLGGHLRLRVRGHRKKATEIRSQSVQNSTNSERDDLREKPDFRGFHEL